MLGLLFLARHLLPVRPILVTLLCLAAFLLVLEAIRVGAARRGALIALPLLQLIWVNCQGLAPLGPALVGCYLIGALTAPAATPERGTALPLALAFATCMMASFATPYGLAAVTLPAHLFGRITPGDNIFSSAIAENIPPFVLDRTSPEMTAHLRAILIVTVAALVLLRPALPLAHVLALVVFGALALMANRNVVLFYWLLAPIGAIALAAPLARRLARLRPQIPLAIALGCELGAAGVALAHEPRIGTPTPFHFPTESAQVLAATSASGPVFAPITTAAISSSPSLACAPTSTRSSSPQRTGVRAVSGAVRRPAVVRRAGRARALPLRRPHDRQSRPLSRPHCAPRLGSRVEAHLHRRVRGAVRTGRRRHEPRGSRHRRRGAGGAGPPLRRAAAARDAARLDLARLLIVVGHPSARWACSTRSLAAGGRIARPRTPGCR